MSETTPETRRRMSARHTQMLLGALCLIFFIDGLGDIGKASESASHFSLVLPIIKTVAGGIGAAVTAWLVLSKRV
jgi:hypothetical protein